VYPFALRVEGLGVFPSALRPRVIWVGLEGDLSALEALQQAVEASVGALGFRPEARDFKPHLTLGRVHDHVAHADRPSLGRALEALNQNRVTSYGEFTAQAVALIRSELRPTGAVYTQLFSAPLAGQ
jgi:2'-5' RNA ligase